MAVIRGCARVSVAGALGSARSESGFYQGAVYLVFQGYRENPVKLNKRAALTDLSKSGILPAVR
jgi:hypothetical protein